MERPACRCCEQEPPSPPSASPQSQFVEAEECRAGVAISTMETTRYRGRRVTLANSRKTPCPGRLARPDSEHI